MNKFFLLFLLVLSLSPLFSQNAETSEVVFDGVIDSLEWKDAQTFDILYEINPGNNTPSPFLTTVYITYSKTHLYVAFDAKADMKTLRSSIRNRDEGFSDDFVMIGIDTYSDGRYMVALGSNPEGNQLDLKMQPNGNDDDSYNVNYESKSVKLGDGYQVELKIPFNVFQFENEKKMQWKVMAFRATYADGKRSQNINFKQDLNNNCLICQTPTVITLEDIKPKGRFEILPYALAGVSGTRENDTFNYAPLNYNLGISGYNDLTNTTSLEYSINPDFSQVEADVSQISVNNSFALFFPERRPYFNEGRDIINTELNTVYTRSINKPIASAKVIHQGEKQRFYWLGAYDLESPYLKGGENNSYSGLGTESVSNIFRYQRTFDQGSNIGIISTNRFFKQGQGHIVGANGRFQLDKYTVEFEYNESIIEEPNADWIESEDVINGKTVKLDGEKYSGAGLSLFAARNTKNWNSYMYYEQKSPLYQTPLGFSAQNNTRGIGGGQTYQRFFEKENFFKQFNVSIEGETRYNYQGVEKFTNVQLSSFSQIEGNARFFANVGYTFREEFKGSVAYNLKSAGLFFGIDPSEVFSFRMFTYIGDAIGYNLDPIQLGTEFRFNTVFTIQPTPKIRINSALRYTQLKKRNAEGFHYQGWIERFNFNYQFNDTFSFRLIAEYNAFGDGSFFYQPLFRWIPNPFTIFYIGGNDGYSRANTESPFVVDNSQIYLKFQYLFPF